MDDESKPLTGGSEVARRLANERAEDLKDRQKSGEDNADRLHGCERVAADQPPKRKLTPRWFDF
jgi:hypothetical protein